MEYKNHETRHIFMAIGIVIFIFSPIFLSFVPQTIANIFHHTNEVWYVFAPEENFVTVALAFLLLFLSSILLFLLDIRKFSLMLSGILVFFSLGCLILVSQSHKTLANDYIAYSPLFSNKEYRYSWDEVEKIKSVNHTDFQEYEFHFTDGNRMKLKYDAYFRVIRHKFDSKVKELQIPIESE